MANYSSSEVKSGILVTTALVLLFGLTFIVGRYTSGAKHDYKVRFGYVSGLEVNAPVYYAGHEVGKVGGIEVLSGEEKPILVTVTIRENIRLKTDSNAFIDTLGMMGEKFVELSPGKAKSPVIQSGSVIEGTDPIPMYVLIQKMNLLADRMDELTTSMNPIMETMDDVLTGNKEEIAKTIANLHETSANVRDMTHDLKFRPWRLVRKG